MERVYGNKYDKTLTTTQIAAKFRQDVKEAIASGALPAGLKVSIRKASFSGGSSITAEVTASPVQILNVQKVVLDDANEWQEARRLPIHTDAAKALLEQIETMLEAYNHDGSDSMTDHFDVRFYAHVGFAHELETAERETIRRGVVDLGGCADAR